MIDWLYTLPEVVLMILPAATLILLLVGLSWSIRNGLGIALNQTEPFRQAMQGVLQPFDWQPPQR